ncbi:hypothetical protein Gpo141_00011525 [Globisporangium polare]
MKRDHRGRVTTRTPGGARTGTSSLRSSLIATHPVELCRYPNKRCWSARVLKDNGELHSFCEWHRNCANQYQRRLEARRRDKKLSGGGSVSSSDATSPATTPVSAAGPAPEDKPDNKPNMCVKGVQSLVEAASRAIASGTATPTPTAAAGAKSPPAVKAKARTPRSVATLPTNTPAGGPGAEYEPFQTPVPLQIEDLQYLSLCFPEAAENGGDGGTCRHSK